MGFMSSPARFDWHIPWRPFYRGGASRILMYQLAIIMIVLSSLIVPTESVACEEEQEHCWNLFLYAQEKLGIRDDYPIPRQPSKQPESLAQQQKSCTVRRTFFVCLSNMSLSCRSDLAFRSAYHVLERLLEQLNCNETGRVFNMSDIPPTPPPQEDAQDRCTFSNVFSDRNSNDNSNNNRNKGGKNNKKVRNSQTRNKQQNGVVSTTATPTTERQKQPKPRVYDYCALYGDPHLRTFGGDYITCRAEGVWPLIDNDYITVQVTNRKHGQGYSVVTSVSEVTVMIKGHPCASEDYLSFVAYSGHLPSFFEDGSYEAGPNGAVFIDELVPNEHIEIYLSYIDTTIVIRQINLSFFSLAVKIPQLIVNETRARAEENSDTFLPVQLCMAGCPPSEQIDYREILVQSHSVRGNSRKRDKKGGDSAVLKTNVMSRDVALEICQAAHLLDYYLDSCVYDLMSTGDSNFSLAVRLAQSDEFQLMPVLLHGHQNRTSLNTSDIDAYAQAHGDEHHVNSAHALSCHYVYLTSFSILILSHLNYIHRTTFVLIFMAVLAIPSYPVCSTS